MERQTANLWPDLEADLGFTQAIRHGDTIYVSGAVGIDENGKIVSDVNVATQIRQAYRNISRSLEALGASLKDVVAETVYVTDLEDARASGEIKKAYDGLQPPTRTVVEVSRLALPELMVEVTCIARI